MPAVVQRVKADASLRTRARPVALPIALRMSLERGNAAARVEVIHELSGHHRQGAETSEAAKVAGLRPATVIRSIKRLVLLWRPPLQDGHALQSG